MLPCDYFSKLVFIFGTKTALYYCPKRDSGLYLFPPRSRGSSVSTNDRGSIPRKAMMGFFIFATTYRPVLGPTQPVQWVPGAPTRG